MDSDDIFAICILGFLVLSPLVLVVSITGCIALSRTRQWQKDKTRSDLEEPLVANDEDDFLDSEDEAEHRAEQQERASDALLTTNQKFKKEFKKLWTGKGAKDLVKQREREERKKLAKAVARELERIERRKAKNTGSLPSYKTATSTDVKQ